MSEQKPAVPLTTRLYGKDVTSSELLLLQVCCEYCSDGSVIWASIEQIAAKSKLSRHTIRQLLRKFEARGWYTSLATASKRPRAYRLNEHAIPDTPKGGAA